jgi:hypothetical protein
VVNPRYHFAVTRRAKEPAWQLSSLKEISQGDSFTKYGPFEHDYRWYVCSGFQVVGVPLEEILQDSEFELRTARFLQQSGGERRLVLVEARYLGPKKGWRREGGLYWAKLDPEKQWLIVEAGVRREAEEEKQELTYQQVNGDIWFPQTLVYSIVDRVRRYKQVRTFQFSEPTRCELPDEQFYLPYYGISEEVLGTVQPRRRVALALLGLGIAGLVGATLIWRSVRNRAVR